MQLNGTALATLYLRAKAATAFSAS